MSARFLRLRSSSRGRSFGLVPVLAVSLFLTTAATADPGSQSSELYDAFIESDITVKDKATGLVWQRVDPPKVDFAGALAACASAPGGMRLPTLKELLTLVDEIPDLKYDEASQTNRALAIDLTAFGRTPDGAFWSSSVTPNPNQPEVWAVFFGEGVPDRVRKDEQAYVRCVRFEP